ncbi:hypothetical protein chiPu_0018005 [Chiloscyllium punctatum]|uniref:Glycosylated lysosomal membrane protein n=1 Tax=Chiloscyllium punctatum TaxID=137246 RepID=A0A401RKF2_CHIPU|nr:hypothetical protein [Chiloscyllium punctatum]
MDVSVSLLLCWFVTVFPELVRGSRSDSHRKVSFEYNPGRSTRRVEPSPNVLHVRAVGSSDTIHYLWSTLGAPTVLLVYTSSPNSSLHINWTRLEQRDPSNAVHVEPAEAVVHSAAVIFSRMDQLVALGENGSTIASFLQWKPVAYTSQHPSLANSVPARQYGLQPGRNHSLPAFSLAYAFYGAPLPGGPRLAAMNISFGGPDRGLYEPGRHIRWSALIGHGEPPQERFSVLVIVIMTVALGLPVLLLLLGGVTVCIIHRRRTTTLYQPVN